MHRTSSWFACASALLLASCGGGGGGTGGVAGHGTLRVLVTDAPFPYGYVESASVVIQEVRVHEKDGDAWTTVLTGSQTIDLVPLSNGVSELLVAASLAPGTYDMVRLIVDAGEVVLTADAVVEDDPVFDTAGGDLKFPSGAQTGIKVNVDNDVVVVTSLSTDLVLDFDLSRNFAFNGPVTHDPGVSRVIFTPHVRAHNASVAGSLVVTVHSDLLTPDDTSDDAPIAGATVAVFAAGADPEVDPPVVTLGTDGTGVAMGSLPPGDYLLVVSADGRASASLPAVQIVLANATDVGIVTLVAVAEEGDEAPAGP